VIVAEDCQEHRLRRHRGRYIVVTVDEARGQTSTRSPKAGATTAFFVRGTGDESLRQVSDYAIRHGESWSSRARAVVALEARGWTVGADGVLS
jgi:hypothetical protein